MAVVNLPILKLHILMQHNLPEKDFYAVSTGLTISKSTNKKLSKNQDAFNKLTKRIEKLQKDIEKKQSQLDLALKIYGTDIYSTKQLVTQYRREFVVLLWANFNTKKLAKNDQQNLKQIIREHLQIYLIELATEPDEEIKKIFNILESSSYDERLTLEKETAKQRMLADLKQMKADLTNIDINDEEALLNKYYEARHKIFNEQSANNSGPQQTHNKNKSAKQLEAERIQQEIDSIQQKNIGTIYKQLAKLFHPDLEQDIERKAEKEILMQQLTSAYEAKNLHALLTLELKWIHKENEHLESLSEEKLAVYLQILKEQAQQLEEEKREIIYQPNYSVLAQTFGIGVQKYPVEIVQIHLNEVRETAENFKMSVADFSSNYALRCIKQMIKQWKQEEDDWEE